MASSTHSPRERLDSLMVSLGLAPSREHAVRTVLAGGVLVNGNIVDKPARLVARDACIEICKRAPFVSRAGEKLAPALEAFSIDPSGAICLDVGCSTGGFTDCLLQKGAAKVYAVDVGYGQLAWKLRQDTRLVLLERTNIRYLDPSLVPELVQLAVIDVSFISLSLVLPSVARFLQEGARVVALVKPQFEVGKGKVGSGGIVRDDGQRADVVRKVMDCAAGLGLLAVGTQESTVKGRKGNREILVAFEYRSKMSARSADPVLARGEDA